MKSSLFQPPGPLVLAVLFSSWTAISIYAQDPLFKFTGKDPNEPKNWQKALNWELNGEPAARVPGTGPDDRVIIPGSEVTNPGSIVKSLTLGGGITGGFLSVKESLVLAGGAFRACTVTILDRATLTSSASGLNSFDSCVVNNRGIFAPGAVGLGALATEPPTVLKNDPLTGRIELQDGSSISSTAGGSIESGGQIVKLRGPGLARIAGINLVQSAAGLVDCQGGTLHLGISSPSPGRFVCNRPVLVSAPDAVIEISGPESELQVGARITGPGRVVIRHVGVSGPISVENLEIPSAGVLDGAGELTLSGVLSINGGNLLGPLEPAAPAASLTVLSTGTLRFAPNQNGAILARNVINAGHVWQEMGGSPGLPLGSTLNFFIENLPGGVIDLTSTGGLGRRGLRNAGTVRKTMSSSLNHDQSLSQGCENSGLIDVQTGLLRCDGLTQTAGELRIAADAEVRFQGAGGSISGGLVSGSGSLRGSSGSRPVRLAGLIRPGRSPGNLTLLKADESLVIDPAAKFEFEIDGIIPGSDFPQLVLNSNGASFPLAGSIGVKFASGFMPMVGQTFPIVRYPSGRVGAFGKFAGLTSAAGIALVPRYTATSLNLVATVDPALAISSVTSSSVTARFQSTVGVAYQLETSMDLVTWGGAGDPIPGDGQTHEVPFPATGQPALFIRLLLN